MIKIKSFTKDWLIPIISAIIIALLINKFVLFKAEVPTGSMLPTIQLHSQIFVTRIYNYKNIKRGEIIVFFSKELNETLIKRVIGLPGDKVEIKEDGGVYVNGTLLKEPYVKIKGGKGGTFNVPKDKYFFLGDDREISYDARYWQNPYISKEDIKGKAQFTVYPFSEFGRLK
jgi:signal peptidase I, bacterial type